MQASAKTVGQILEPRGQFVIPFFQRHYSWEQKQWRRLWNDLTKLLELEVRVPGSNAVHFLGPLVTIPLTSTPGGLPAWQVIDGQQRLTTLTLLLAALRDFCRDTDQETLAAEISDTCLLNPHKTDLERFKVITRIGDRETLELIVEGGEQSGAPNRLLSGHRFFADRIRALATRDPASLRRLMTAIAGRLSLVTITLEGENPYEIFESLNATGLPLEESDLIRNYLFMQVPLGEQEGFQQREWSKLESLFEGGKSTGIPTDFYRTYLMRNGVYSKQKQTYVDFRSEHQNSMATPASLVAELRRFAEFDCWLRDPAACPSKEVRKRLNQLRLLDTSTARPLVFNLLDRHASGAIATDTLLGCLDDLLSFILRRALCGETTRQYSRWLVEAINEIGVENPRAALQRYFARRGWPSDETFIAAASTLPIYLKEFGKARLVLECLEAALNPREQIGDDGISIEHVMPRTLGEGESGASWRAALGEDWEETHEKLVHVIGNLSLTGANSDLSNRDFRSKKGILESSRFLLNREIAAVDAWTPEHIEARSLQLAGRIAALWPRPAAVPSGAAARSSRQSRNETRKGKARYWEAVLPALERLDFLDAIPQARTVGLIGIPLTRKAFRYGLRPRFYKRKLGLILFLRGPDREHNFDQLLRDRDAIERTVGSPLQWQKNVRWSNATSVIELVGEHLDPNDPATLPQQAEWFVANLERFHAAFHDRCTALAPNEKPREMTPVRRRRQRWWALVLAELEKVSDLFVGRRPPPETWMGAGSGISGVGFVLAAAGKSSSAQLYIDFGAGRKEENKQFFDKVLGHRQAIEQAFGAELQWDRLDGKRASAVYWTQPVGYASSEDDWPAITAKQADAMDRFTKAMRPVLTELSEANR